MIELKYEVIGGKYGRLYFGGSCSLQTVWPASVLRDDHHHTLLIAKKKLFRCCLVLQRRKEVVTLDRVEI